MNEKELLKLIEKGESGRVEFKKSLRLHDEIGEAVSAFCNTNEGILLVGVSDSGMVKGAQVGKRTMEDLANYIKRNTDPQVYPSVEVVQADGKDVVVVKVNESHEKPVFFKKHAYKRVSKSSHRISSSEMRKLAKESGPKVYWDEGSCEGATLEDIDDEKVRWFREKYKDVNSTELKGTDEDILKTLSCLKDVNRQLHLTNAGVLLFGKEPQKYFPYSRIKIAIYPGTTVGIEHIDIKDFEGDLFYLVDEAEKYIRRYVYSPSILKFGQIAREEVPQYPYFAIRELIVNALVHRDYAVRGSKIIIKIFRDRIEYQSPGTLPANITPKNIVKEQFLRNPAIGKAFSKIRYIEEMGEGWDRIIEEVRKHPLKPRLPNVEDTGASVIVTLYSANIGLMQVDEKLTEVDDWLTMVDIRSLSDKEIKICKFVQKNDKITSADMRKMLGISREMASRYVKRLIEKGILEKKGRGPETYYILVKK